jgi:hypothetical protein
MENDQNIVNNKKNQWFDPLLHAFNLLKLFIWNKWMLFEFLWNLWEIKMP